MTFYVVRLYGTFRGEEFTANVRVESTDADDYVTAAHVAVERAKADRTLWSQVDDFGDNGCGVDFVFDDFNPATEKVVISPDVDVSHHQVMTRSITVPV